MRSSIARRPLAATVATVLVAATPALAAAPTFNPAANPGVRTTPVAPRSLGGTAPPVATQPTGATTPAAGASGAVGATAPAGVTAATGATAATGVTTPAPTPAPTPATPAAPTHSGTSHHHSSWPSAGVIALWAAGIVLGLAALWLVALWFTGVEPKWFGGARHALGEAGYRGGAVLEEFGDWLRIGR